MSSPHNHAHLADQGLGSEIGRWSHERSHLLSADERAHLLKTHQTRVQSDASWQCHNARPNDSGCPGWICFIGATQFACMPLPTWNSLLSIIPLAALRCVARASPIQNK